MAWYIATFRHTVRGGMTEARVIAPDGTELNLVPMDERGKPVDLENPIARSRAPGIVHRWRGKTNKTGQDHYWVPGAGREYLILVTDVAGSGERTVRVEQRPEAPTEVQERLAVEAFEREGA